MGGRVGVQLVEVSHPHRQKGIGKKLDRLGLGAVGQQHRNILLDGPLAQEIGKHLRPRRLLTHDDAGRVKIVVKRPAFPQKLRRENEIAATQLLPGLFGIAHRHGGLDDHQRIRIDRHHIADHRLNGTGIEVVGLGIVIGGCGNHYKIGILVGACGI